MADFFASADTEQRGGAGTLPPVAVVGAGAVGRALARRLHVAGYPVAAVLSRSAGPARALAAAVEAPVASDALAALPTHVRTLFLCVPDAAVRGVAAELAAQENHPWEQCLVAHTSGALPAGALRPLAAAGATTLSFHPLQAFTQATPPEVFAGLPIGVQGTEEAVAAGGRLAEALGGHPLVLPAEAKARYHLAASMASNFLVTLTALAAEVLDDALGAHSGVSPDTSSPEDRPAYSQEIDGGAAAAALLPLLEGTLKNLREAPPGAALTGPVARGDGATVQAHLEALRAHHPGFVPVYAALAAETVRLAVRAGRLPSSDADDLLDRLTDALQQGAEAGGGGGDHPA